jgi:hypothetical protein
MNDFATSVALYRLAHRPPFVEGQFAYAGPCSTELSQVISDCSRLPSTVGEFVGLPQTQASDVQFRWMPGHNPSACYYMSTDELVERSTALSRGDRPANFYLVEEDYLADESNPPARLQAAFRLCDLVAALSKLALTSADLKDAPSRVLLFIQPAGEKTLPKTLELTPRILPDMLDMPVPDLSSVEQLVADGADKQLHVAERRGFFRLAVADVLIEPEGKNQPFLHLVRSWARVLESYQRNVEVYLSNFSFEKLRLDVATASVDYAGKLTKSLNDSTAKLLALPLSFAAVAGVQVSPSFMGATIAVLGALLVSILLAAMLQNQLLELRAIRTGFANVFDPLAREAGSDTVIGCVLRDARTAFTRQSGLLIKVMWTVRCIAWIPPLWGTGLLAWRFDPRMHAWLVDAMQYILMP